VCERECCLIIVKQNSDTSDGIQSPSRSKHEQLMYNVPDAFVSTNVKENGGRSSALKCKSQGNTHGARNSGSSISV
jgi:hypothetical protein